MTDSADCLNYDGSKPRMHDLLHLFTNPDEKDIPFYVLSCDDTLMSSICVQGALDSPEDWKEGIWYNSRLFQFSIVTASGRRLYEDGKKVTIEVWREYCRPKEGVKPFKKYTGTPEACAKKMVEWLKLCVESQPNK